GPGRGRGVAGPAGRRWLPGRPLPAPHQPGVRGVRDRAWPVVLVVSGRAAHLVRRRSQRRGRPTALAAQPAPTAVGQRRPTRPRRLRQPAATPTLRKPPARHRPATLVPGRWPISRAPVVALEWVCG